MNINLFMTSCCPFNQCLMRPCQNKWLFLLKSNQSFEAVRLIILVSRLARMGCVFSAKILIALTKNSGWHASPNFFWLMVGDPSSGKSNVLGATNKPIQKLENLARELYKKEYRTYKTDLVSKEV